MYESAVFDPTSAVIGTFNTNLPINGKFVLYNESNVGLSITFADGTTGYAPAWWASLFTQSVPSPVVTWTQKAILAGSTTSISQVLVECYLPNENVNGTYPAAIQHNAYVTNTINANTVSNTLTNNSNSSETPIIQIGTTGNNNDIVINNDGGAVWKVEQSGTPHQAIKTQTAGNPLQLGQAGDTTEVLGSMKMDQHLTINDILSSSNGTAVFIANGLDTYISSSGNGNIIHLQYGGNDAATIGSSGINMKVGGFNGLSGDQLSRVGSCSGTGSGTVSHSLGATPDFVAITPHQSASSATTGYFSESSTQITVTLGAALTWFGFLTKRS